MRPIKFRVWNARVPFCEGEEERSKEMILLEPFDGGLDGEYMIESGCYCDDEAVVMQFTGLLDKNGREIYENDIVRHIAIRRALSSEGGEVGEVIWVNENAGFYIKGNRWITMSRGLKQRELFRLDGNAEVLGNIYQNPDLLPQEN